MNKTLVVMGIGTALLLTGCGGEAKHPEEWNSHHYQVRYVSSQELDFILG